MGSSDVDKLLESYLTSDESSGHPAKPGFPISSPPHGAASDDLDALLARYLETSAPTERGENASPSFTLPRKAEIDDMLKSYRKDQSPERSAALRRGLADHVDAVDSTRRAVGSTIDETPGSSNDVWRKRTASDIHRQRDISEKIALYAQALEDEEAAFLDQSSEELYAFDPTGSTIHGMPPGDAPRAISKEDKK